MSASRTNKLPPAARQAYAWHREARPRDEPDLRFDTHFQDDGLAVSPHDHILVGVSGGSDSLALLLLLVDWRTSNPSLVLTAATVDHGLRPEAAKEAETVGAICAGLDLPHTILRDGESTIKSAADARNMRLRLLHDHANEVGAPCIALGHTLN
ncbi:MAG: ATP-binding protein, partial [Pseudomonadota bacterium]